MNNRLLIPRRFHPGYSLLARLIKYRVNDFRRAEGLYFIVLSLVAVGLLLAQYGAWAVVGGTIQSDPSGSMALTFWIAQICGAVLLVGIGVVGFSPPIAIVISDDRLTIIRNRRETTVRFNEIESAEPIDRRTYYTHYMRFAAVQKFVGKLHDEVLLLRTADQLFAIGLNIEGRRAVLSKLTTIPAAKKLVAA